MCLIFQLIYQNCIYVTDYSFLQLLKATLKYVALHTVSSYSPIDKGYAWIILVVAALHNVHFGALLGHIGILMLECVYYFEISVFQATWISTCAMVTGCIFGT